MTVGNTPQSFFDKWSKNASAFYAETLREGSDTQLWILQRNGYAIPQAWAERLATCARVLDAGCGNGRVTALLRQLAPAQSEVLGVEAGEYDVQRLLYHFFAKCYWNPDLSEHENVLINYDWYHPQIATRHTLEEVEAWFARAGLKVVHTHVDFYGITARGRRVS